MAKDFVVNLNNPRDTPEQIAEKLNSLTYALDHKVIKGAVTREEFDGFKTKTEKYVNGNKERTESIKNDLRYHGAGLSKVIHDATLTGDGTVGSPLAAVNSGSGTVTTVSVTTANGASGTVTNPTTTPAISLSFATQSANDNSTKVATTAYVDASSFNDINIRTMQTLGSVIKAQTFGSDLSKITTTTTLVSGVAKFIAVYLSTPQTITGIKWWQSTAGNYTADASNVVALYTYSAGTLTQVAGSTDDGTIWKTTSTTMGSKAFSSQYIAIPGLYFIGILYHTSAQSTAPILGAITGPLSPVIYAADFTNSSLIVGNLSAQTSLPSPQAMSGLAQTSNMPWVALY